VKSIVVAGVVAALVATSTATAALIVTSANIKNGTIKLVDISPSAKRALKGNRGPRGLAGAPGAQGAQGLQGPQGIQSITGVSASISIPPGGISYVIAYCPAGMNPVSGGSSFISAEGEVFFSYRSGNAWAVGGDNFDATFTNGDLTAYAYCSPNVTISGSATSPIQLERLVDAQRASHISH
jgi:hypothetical protein